MPLVDAAPPASTASLSSSIALDAAPIPTAVPDAPFPSMLRSPPSSSTPVLRPALVAHGSTRTLPFSELHPVTVAITSQSSTTNPQPLKPTTPAASLLPQSGLSKRISCASSDAATAGTIVVSIDDSLEKGPATMAGSLPSLPASGAHGVPHKTLVRNLVLFVILKVLGSFDSGAFSATLNGDNGITEDWGLTVSQQGTLSSSVFLGNMIGCAIAGHLFSIYSAKMLLVVALIIHGFFTFLFASAESYEFALLCRFFIGVTLAFIVVYTPVWVDEFAPKHAAATWMALQNAGVPLGIMLGFVIGGLMPTYTSISWEWAFFFKTIIMVPIIGLVAKTERRTLDSASQAAAVKVFQKESTAMGTSVVSSTPASESPNSASPVVVVSESLFQSLRDIYQRTAFIALRLARNGVYVSNMLSMSSLYFVVSGLQTFVTSYLRAEPFNASMDTIVIGFGCAVVTAPVFGVVCGGVLLDKIGGYHGNIYRAARFGLIWGVAAGVVGIICAFITDTTRFLLVVWVLLFCGGAIIPPGSGINMASLPEALRPTGSSVSQMAFNFLGNFSGPLVCGWVAEWTGSLTWGIRLVFGMGVVGVLPMVACTYFAARRTGNFRRRASAAENEGESDEADATYHIDDDADGDAEEGTLGDDDDEDISCDDAPKTTTAAEAANTSLVTVGQQGADASQSLQRDGAGVPSRASTVCAAAVTEELVPESGQRHSPRNLEEDIELASMSRSLSRGNSHRGPSPPLSSGKWTLAALHNSERSTPSPAAPSAATTRGPLFISVPKSPHIAPSGTSSSAMLMPNSVLCPGSGFLSSGMISFTAAPTDGSVPSSANRHTHVQHHSSGNRPHSRAASNASPIAPVPMPVLLASDDLDTSALDSGRFNLSFPNQHSFGLDVVRNLIRSTTSVTHATDAGDRTSVQTTPQRGSQERRGRTPTPMAPVAVPRLETAA